MVRKALKEFKDHKGQAALKDRRDRRDQVVLLVQSVDQQEHPEFVVPAGLVV